MPKTTAAKKGTKAKHPQCSAEDKSLTSLVETKRAGVSAEPQVQVKVDNIQICAPEPPEAVNNQRTIAPEDGTPEPPAPVVNEDKMALEHGMPEPPEAEASINEDTSAPEDGMLEPPKTGNKEVTVAPEDDKPDPPKAASNKNIAAPEKDREEKEQPKSDGSPDHDMASEKGEDDSVYSSSSEDSGDESDWAPGDD